MKFNKVIDEVCRNDSNNQNIQEILQSIIHTIDHSGENILFYAKQISDVQCLIDKGADINIINNNGENILFQHIRERNNDIVKILIDKGTNYKIVNNVGDNLLSISCRFSNFEMIDYFMKLGLTLNSEQSKAIFYKIAEKPEKFSDIFNIIYNLLDFSFFNETYKGNKNLLHFILSDKNKLHKIREQYNIFNEDFFIELIKNNLDITYENGNNIFLLGARHLPYEDFYLIYNLYDFKDYTNDQGENILFISTTYENTSILKNIINNEKALSSIDKHQKNIHGHNLIQHMEKKGIHNKYPEIFSLYQNFF